jgi:hypothetical protein
VVGGHPDGFQVQALGVGYESDGDEDKVGLELLLTLLAGAVTVALPSFTATPSTFVLTRQRMPRASKALEHAAEVGVFEGTRKSRARRR